MSSVEEKMQQELSKLGEEAQALVAERESIKNRMHEIDTRLTQIAGAMVSINNIIGSGE